MNNEPSRYRSRPVEVLAIHLEQYGDFVRAFRWIRENGGHARHLTSGGEDTLLIDTPEGTMEAPVGYWVIRGTEHEFYPCKPSVFADRYDVVAHATVSTSATLGTYQADSAA